MREIEHWITEEELKDIYTSSYWNDIEIEKKNAWWIADGDYEKCLDYLKSSNLLLQYKESEEYIKNFVDEKENIFIADLAAGIGWTSALLSKLPSVDKVFTVEISKHRLGHLFESCCNMLQGNSKKINRYLGSFYDLKFDNNSIDLIYLSQAFHHAENPLKLIIECDRVLKNDGRIILIGEHYIGPFQIIRKILSNLIKRRYFSTNFYKIFTPDEILGDHYYRNSDYYFFFQSLGYDLKHKTLIDNTTIYIADKKKS